MKLPIRFVAVALVLSLAAPALVRAETEYDFAKALMDRSEPSFGTDDLVERLIARLEEAPNGALDAKLIKATLMRRQAAAATAERRPALLSDAQALFKEVAATPNTALAETAKHELETLGKELRHAQFQAIGKSDPAKAKDLRAQAAADLEKDAAVLKARADDANPKFLAAVKKLEQDQTAHESAQGYRPPRELIADVDKYYDEWTINDCVGKLFFSDYGAAAGSRRKSV